MLSDAGQALLPVMDAMCAWATEHLGVKGNMPRLKAS
jgi:DNA-binding HxlR family transcriptional regulator